MQPAFLLSLVGSLFAISAIVVTVAAFRRAPEGFEDETGFHALSATNAEQSTGTLQAGLSHS